MLKMITLCIAISFLVIAGIASHAIGDGAMKNYINRKNTIQDIPQRKWDILAQRKIFFGHQSVGYNIITGIEQILKKYPNIKLNIVKTKSADDFNKPVFAHEWIGSNMAPESKISAFVEIMRDGVGGKADFAFMKMCYVDVTATTNVQRVFQDYKEKMAQVARQFPETKIIYVTVPLTAKPKGMKAVKQTGKNIIKKIMGNPVFDYKDNINRNKLNEMLRAEYAGKAPFFDLALLEATGPDGEHSVFIQDGEQVMTLTNGYTDDGGHLNPEGSRRLAEQLLILLANLK